ncbi:hypothetical protein VPH35_018956 [Triticum aestivum]
MSFDLSIAQLLTLLSRPKVATDGNESSHTELSEAAMAGLVSLLRQLGDPAQYVAPVPPSCCILQVCNCTSSASASPWLSIRTCGYVLQIHQTSFEPDLQACRGGVRRPARPSDGGVRSGARPHAGGTAARGGAAARRGAEWTALLPAHTRLCTSSARSYPVADHRVDRPPPVIVVGGTRPCSIAKLIQGRRGPPQLSMLDKYDAGGEGACLKRYTDPSFRTHSAQHINQTRPSVFKTGTLSDTLRQLKYRYMIRRFRRQMHTLHNQHSSESEASETHILSSADSPEMSNTEAPCPAVPVTKERSNYLVESSFGAWLSPGAASTRACDITEDNGANKADENANIATDGRSALVDFIASRVESLPRKLSVKKHVDPLAESLT